MSHFTQNQDTTFLKPSGKVCDILNQKKNTILTNLKNCCQSTLKVVEIKLVRSKQLISQPQELQTTKMTNLPIPLEQLLVTVGMQTILANNKY